MGVASPCRPGRTGANRAREAFGRGARTPRPITTSSLASCGSVADSPMRSGASALHVTTSAGQSRLPSDSVSLLGPTALRVADSDTDQASPMGRHCTRRVAARPARRTRAKTRKTKPSRREQRRTRQRRSDPCWRTGDARPSRIVTPGFRRVVVVSAFEPTSVSYSPSQNSDARPSVPSPLRAWVQTFALARSSRQADDEGPGGASRSYRAKPRIVPPFVTKRGAHGQTNLYELQAAGVLCQLRT